MNKTIKRISFFYRADNPQASIWEKKIKTWLKRKYPAIRLVKNNPQALIVLGGDGTILEAARKYARVNPIIFGLNLGHVGFLASARKPKKFLSSLDDFLRGNYWIVNRMMMNASVLRKNKQIFTTNSLNDVTIQNPLGMVEIEASIEDHPFQYIHGTGALVSTATGSTAYNLSAHGPIVMPDLNCFILTELLDHNIPTPSLVIKQDKKISLKIISFRKRGLLSIANTHKKVDVILAADSENIFPLEEGDIVNISRSSRLIKFAEIEKNYFLKSLEEKFAFK